MIAELLARIAAEEAAEQRRDGVWRPRCSSAGTERCVRQEVYKAHGVKAAPIPGRTIILFDDGFWHEELTIAWIQKSVFRHHSGQMGVDTVYVPGSHPGYRCGICSTAKAEVRVPEGMVHGHIDGIVTDPMGTDFLWEHKSASRFAFARWAKGDEVPLDYLTQMVLYAWGLRHLGTRLERAILLIKCKDTSAYMEYVVRVPTSLGLEEPTVIESAIFMEGDHPEDVPLTKAQRTVTGLITNAIVRFAEIVKHRNEETLPARPFARDHWRCSYCQFEGTCWKGWAEDVKDRKADDAIELEPDSELGELIVRAQLANARAGAAEKQADVLKDEVKVGLNEVEVVSASVNLDDAVVTAKITMSGRSSWDEDKIPEAIVKKAKVYKESPKLNLRRGKPKGD